MRKKIIAGNWKMHKTVKEAKELVEQLKEKSLNDKVDIVLCVPFTNLSVLKDALQGSNIHLGAQNMHPETEGAFTGEISPLMLKEIGVEYVILGHSERRTLFQETNEFIHEKLVSALGHDLIPILCVGENLEEREDGRLEEVLEEELKTAFQDIKIEDAKKVIIAYEPIWAIGTGKTASKEDANETIAFIRKTMEGLYNTSLSEKIRIQYGGSVKPSNVQELMSMEHIDGALVGGASLKADDFEKLANYNL